MALMLFGARKAGSLEGLAAAISRPAALRCSVERYNAAAAREADELGKSADMCQALGPAPYFALDLSIGSAPLPLATITLGGLRVNEADGHVRDDEGRDIPGCTPPVAPRWALRRRATSAACRWPTVCSPAGARRGCRVRRQEETR